MPKDQKLQRPVDNDIVDSSHNEPPVVARLIIEIRSDGTQTIARGAMEDVVTGEKVAIEARGTTPFSLALGMAKSMMRGRVFARTTIRSLLPRSKKKR